MWRALLALSLVAPRIGGAQTVRLDAERDSALRIVVSIADRRLLVIDREYDTLLVAAVAVGSGETIGYAAHRWTFDTPRGVRTVLSKDSAPVWIPPDWHYIEVARREHLELAWLSGDTTIAYDANAKLIVDRDGARFVDARGTDAFGIGEHIVVDDVLFVPSLSSPNRKIPGELGEFRLSLGDGFGIHGTRDKDSVGRAVTHGCMRLSDDDIAWLYHHVPLGTRVYIY